MKGRQSMMRSEKKKAGEAKAGKTNKTGRFFGYGMLHPAGCPNLVFMSNTSSMSPNASVSQVLENSQGSNLAVNLDFPIRERGGAYPQTVGYQGLGAGDTFWNKALDGPPIIPYYVTPKVNTPTIESPFFDAGSNARHNLFSIGYLRVNQNNGTGSFQISTKNGTLCLAIGNGVPVGPRFNEATSNSVGRPAFVQCNQCTKFNHCLWTFVQGAQDGPGNASASGSLPGINGYVNTDKGRVLPQKPETNLNGSTVPTAFPPLIYYHKGNYASLPASVTADIQSASDYKGAALWGQLAESNWGLSGYCLAFGTYNGTTFNEATSTADSCPAYPKTAPNGTALGIAPCKTAQTNYLITGSKVLEDYLLKGNSGSTIAGAFSQMWDMTQFAGMVPQVDPVQPNSGYSWQKTGAYPQGMYPSPPPR